MGNVDAGKSTLLGVLTHGELDNGRGFARQKLFRHKHEMESGRTSSVGNDILGFDQEGQVRHREDASLSQAKREHGRLPFASTQVVNKPDSHGGSLDWTKICEKSSKVITFIDLAGHEKYLKTTVFGMTGHLPDFCMLMVRRGRKHAGFLCVLRVTSSACRCPQVGSNAGIVGMTKEHLGLALALNVPVFVVVTKIDMCPANILQGCRQDNALVRTQGLPRLSPNSSSLGDRDAEAAAEVAQVPRLQEDPRPGAEQGRRHSNGFKLQLREVADPISDSEQRE